MSRRVRQLVDVLDEQPVEPQPQPARYNVLDSVAAERPAAVEPRWETIGEWNADGTPWRG